MQHDVNIGLIKEEIFNEIKKLYSISTTEGKYVITNSKSNNSKVFTAENNVFSLRSLIPIMELWNKTETINVESMKILPNYNVNVSNKNQFEITNTEYKIEIVFSTEYVTSIYTKFIRVKNVEQIDFTSLNGVFTDMYYHLDDMFNAIQHRKKVNIESHDDLLFKFNNEFKNYLQRTNKFVGKEKSIYTLCTDKIYFSAEYDEIHVYVKYYVNNQQYVTIMPLTEKGLTKLVEEIEMVHNRLSVSNDQQLTTYFLLDELKTNLQRNNEYKHTEIVLNEENKHILKISNKNIVSVEIKLENSDEIIPSNMYYEIAYKKLSSVTLSNSLDDTHTVEEELAQTAKNIISIENTFN